MIHKNILDLENIFKSDKGNVINKYGISLIYIFGSYATGRNDSNSDIDIAVLFKEPYNHMQKLYLLGELNTLFKRDDIDLVILNSANAVLKHQVIKYGKVIYAESIDIKVDFEVKVLREYMDMEPFRKRQAEIVRAQISDMLKEARE